jgi:pyruvate,water dikinase
VLERVIAYARTYLLLRENQRFWFDHLLASLQGVLLFLGDHAVREGWLADRADVALVTWPELRIAALGGRPPDRAVIEARRAARAEDLRVDPPTFLVGDDPGPPDRGARRLQGLGISSGRVRGRVRVVRSLDEGHTLERGEILVTRAVDPGWTPLFLTAAGVVLEMGSLLSHGAVVAREYGLPAVVNIERATSRLATGQEITVDGSRGLVWVHSIASPGTAAAESPGPGG